MFLVLGQLLRVQERRKVVLAIQGLSSWRGGRLTVARL
jgi:hypothetical protein